MNDWEKDREKVMAENTRLRQAVVLAHPWLQYAADSTLAAAPSIQKALIKFEALINE